MTHRPSIGIIGAGRVGQTLARLWHEKGYTIAAIYNPTAQRAQLLATRTAAMAVSAASDVCHAADLICLTVPDDAITTVADNLTQHPIGWQGKAVIHTSGATDNTPLGPLATQGAMVGSLHPAFPFADPDQAIQTLSGATFAIDTTDDTLREWLTNLVAAVDGHTIDIPTGKKALYHAALVMLSNYTVTLYAAAEHLLTSIDAQPDAIHAALDTLLAATAQNISTRGIPDALTGPLVRADSKTIQAHLAALKAYPQTHATYIALAQQTLLLVQQRNIDTTILENILQETTD